MLAENKLAEVFVICQKQPLPFDSESQNLSIGCSRSDFGDKLHVVPGVPQAGDQRCSHTLVCQPKHGRLSEDEILVCNEIGRECLGGENIVTGQSRMIR